MKPYVPNQMIYAVQKVEEEHPLTDKEPTPLSDSALRELVLLIDSKSMDSLRDFSALLSRRESNALCRYLRSNTYKVDLKKIVQVVYFCMNRGNYWTLFQVWQHTPACQEALFLLGSFDEPQYHNDDFPVHQGLLSAWAKASLPITAIAQTSTDIGKGNSFRERFFSIGLDPDSVLAMKCYQQFLCRATIAQLLQEGDHQLWDVLCKSEKSIQEQILIHILNYGDSAERQLLPSLKETYQKAYALWKEPNSNYFPKGHQKAFETYVWWFNYFQLTSAFGRDTDYRRINYWKQYLHYCTCTRIQKHSMLIMNFGDYTVTEFENMGAVYIFEASYYKSVVTGKMNVYNTADLKSWLYNFAVKMDRQTHTQRWEINQTRALRRFKII